MKKTKYTKPTISILHLEMICLSSASGEIDDDKNSLISAFGIFNFNLPYCFKCLLCVLGSEWGLTLIISRLTQGGDIKNAWSVNPKRDTFQVLYINYKMILIKRTQ